MSSPSESVIDAYWQTPPMARIFSTTVFVLSTAIHFGLMPSTWFVHHPYFLWQIPPQIWRVVTTYFVTSGLGILFDTYFSYRYLSELEVGHPRFPRKEDLLWYLIFVGGTVLGINYFVDISFFMVHALDALILALCYTVTQDQRGVKATFYFVTIPAQLTPYCMILMNIFFGGPQRIVVQLEGLVAAHLYDFLTRLWPEFGGGVNLIPAPAFLSRLVQTPRLLRRDYGTAFRAGNNASSGQSTGASAGPLPDAWRTRGKGQRLG
ncbi:Derlin-2 [Paramyrothecium foliicola]|nr:Derlin-2 [Paramyrothecium foliicola]